MPTAQASITQIVSAQSYFANIFTYLTNYYYYYYNPVSTTNATAAQAASLQASAAVKSFTVKDTAANIALYFDRLNADTKLTAVTLSNSAPIAITAAQFAADTSVIGKLPAGTKFTLSGVALANAAAVQANASVAAFSVTDSVANVVAAGGWVAADTKLTAVAVSDTAANVLARIGTLAGYSHLTAISLTGGNVLAVTAGQYASYAGTLDLLAPNNYLTVSGATVASAQAVQRDVHVGSFTVSDTTANVLAGLAALRGDSKLGSISLTDGTSVSVSFAQYASYVGVLDRLAKGSTITVTGTAAGSARAVAADAHVGKIAVADTLARIGSNLASLEALAKKGVLSGIAVTDSGQTLTLTDAQYAADADAIALMSGAFTISHPGSTPTPTPTPTPIPTGHLNINVIWDSSVGSAPAGFKTAVQAAVAYFDNLITSPVTINISVGYGEAGGSALGSGTLGEAETLGGTTMTAAQFKAALSAGVASDAAIQTALANLSSTGSVYVTSAQQKALGLIPGTGTTLDAAIGFARDPNGNLFTYDPNNRAVPGKYDLIGVVEHELSHALGRASYVGVTTSLDLYRYSAPGVRAAAGSVSYFSIDGGVTNLDSFDTTSDTADWASSAGNDANNAYSNIGVQNSFTAADVTALNVLGYSINSAAAAAATVSASSGLNAASLAFVGTPAVVATGSAATSVTLALVAAPGVAEVTGFQYGLDHLILDLTGISGTLRAFDTSVNGAHAISIAGSGDLAHGVVLLGLPASATAANLLASHLTISGSTATIA